MKSTKYETAETVAPEGRPMGIIRVGRVVYDHHPISPDPHGVSIGTMIDQHIYEVIKSGALVNEVSLIFETPEQQHELARFYHDHIG